MQVGAAHTGGGFDQAGAVGGELDLAVNRSVVDSQRGQDAEGVVDQRLLFRASAGQEAGTRTEVGDPVGADVMCDDIPATPCRTLCRWFVLPDRR